MPPPDTDWKVLPHDPLTQLADNLWWVQGDLPNMKLRRAMTVARLAGGDLVLHSAMALDEAGMEALEALGRPAFLVVPNGWHRLDAPRYKARYPDLTVISSPGARKLVERLVPVDATYEDRPQPDPDDDTVRFEHFGDRKKMEGAMIVRSPDGVSLVFGDSLFNVPHGKGLFWTVYGRMMGATGGPRVTPMGRLFMTLGGARKGYKRWLEGKGVDSEVVRLVPGHGAVVAEDARATLRSVAATL